MCISGACLRRAGLILLLSLAADSPAFGQNFGVAVNSSGSPFVFFQPGSTQTEALTSYLDDRVSQQAKWQDHLQAQSDLRQSGGGDPNAYWNKSRDTSQLAAYEIQSRQRLDAAYRRAPLPRPGPAPPVPIPNTTPAPRPDPAKLLASFFKGDGTLDWPLEPGNEGELSPNRQAADVAARALLAELNAGSKVKIATINEAKGRLIAYGQPALARIRTDRTARVSDLYHSFLLQLLDAIERAAPPT